MKSYLVLLAAMTAPFSASAFTASCACEHFGTQYDQFCEASPFEYGKEYLYEWSAAPDVILSHSESTTPTVHADCVNGRGCVIKVDVTVTEYTWWGYMLWKSGSDSTTCASGTGTGDFSGTGSQ